MVRASVEDALVLLNLLLKFPDHADKVDLRAEIRALPSLEGLTKSAGSAESKINFDFNELGAFGFVHYK